MRDRILNATGVLLGGLIGYRTADAVINLHVAPALPDLSLIIAGIAAGGVVGLLVAPALGRGFVGVMSRVLRGLAGFSLHDLLLGGFGLIAGLLLALFIGYLLEGLPLIGPYVRVVAGLVFGYLGLHVGLQRRDEVTGLFSRRPAEARTERAPGGAVPKLLDSSVIIDGRIADICRSGFLEGPLLVPRSVLAEVQRIADSSDVLRRGRGRRGLDILNRLQREFETVRIVEDQAAPGADVDAQIVSLARAHRAWMVTNDFNLSKVAELQGVRVLNVNELAQALRPAVLPGEDLTVHVIRDGKEAGQGVAYLEDGTMIVVEGGKRLIGEASDVVVTSVLQTSAGRMIFARPKSTEPTGSSSSQKR